MWAVWVHVTSFELVFLNDGAVFVSCWVGVATHLLLLFEPGVADSAHEGHVDGPDHDLMGEEVKEGVEWGVFCVLDDIFEGGTEVF